ncbi:hypothetical protein Trydic_g64 [Trypoxylus dichotomus]
MLRRPSEIIISQGYRLHLMHLKQAIQERRLEYRDRHEKLSLPHGNDPPHVGQLIRAYIEEVKWEIPPHSPYSPDIAPSGYHLFLSMRVVFSGERFSLCGRI